MSRRLTKQLLDDLCGRLKEQVNIAMSIEATAKPTGETIVAEYPMRKVIELSAAALVRGLRDAKDFAEIITERVSS
jgi:hypothetical protein